MKKVIIIIVVLLVAGFFTFVNVDIEDNNKLAFLDNSEIDCVDYKVEKIFSSKDDEKGLRLTFHECEIDTTIINTFGEICKKMAVQINNELNTDDEFQNIILIFKPKNGEIITDELMSVHELMYRYEVSEL